MHRSRILIVDDDPLTRDVLLDILPQSGSYRPDIAGDGHDGLKKSKEVSSIDIGEIGVCDTILLKPGKLTAEERNEINLHPVIGGNIIKPLRFFPKQRDLIIHHHEHFNGSGYPDGLTGTTIPVTARILAADAYDAMTSSRPYRQARLHEHAAAELMRIANTQFDGEIVRAFLQ
jgi:HD-GYP domain-containing protein (c-di-GMP phosphodiesterase class II)